MNILNYGHFGIEEMIGFLTAVGQEVRGYMFKGQN